MEFGGPGIFRDADRVHLRPTREDYGSLHSKIKYCGVNPKKSGGYFVRLVTHLGQDLGMIVSEMSSGGGRTGPFLPAFHPFFEVLCCNSRFYIRRSVFREPFF